MKSFKGFVKENTVSKPLYHGSNFDFDRFSFRRHRTGGKAIFLTTSYENALSYGPIVYLVQPISNKLFKFYDNRDMSKLINKVDKILEREKKKDYRKRRDFYPYTKSKVINSIKEGKWHFIEHPIIIEAIKSLKYDGFFAIEGPNLNYGYFDPKNLKILKKFYTSF